MKGGNYSWLILAILRLLTGIPAAEEFDAMSPSLARALALSCLLGIGALSFKGHGRVYAVALFIVATGVLLNIVAAQTTSVVAVYGSFFAVMAFLSFAIAVTFRNVATDPDISVNRIAGVVSAYISDRGQAGRTD